MNRTRLCPKSITFHALETRLAIMCISLIARAPIFLLLFMLLSLLLLHSVQQPAKYHYNISLHSCCLCFCRGEFHNKISYVSRLYVIFLCLCSSLLKQFIIRHIFYELSWLIGKTEFSILIVLLCFQFCSSFQDSLGP